MEKREPSYSLSAFKAACADAKLMNMSVTAIKSSLVLGFSREDVSETVQTMRSSHFYKSMTSYADHRVWQDVYHVPSAVGTLYIKFTADAVTEFLLLSFKEKENG